MSTINKRTKAGFAYIFLVHLFLAFVLWKSNFIEKVSGRFGPTSFAVSFYKQMVIYHKTMDGSIPEGAVLFIGDSITQALATSAVTNRSINFGIGSDTTLGVVGRLPLYKSINRSRAIVLAVGINDIHQGVDQMDTLTNYRDVLEYIPSDIPVFAVSVLPIGSDAERFGFTNTKIEALNDGIEELTGNFDNVEYLDISDKYRNSAGRLDNNFHVGDGVHLSDAGYAILIRSLRETVAP